MSDEVIRTDDLPPFFHSPAKQSVDFQQHGEQTLKDFREEMEKEFILMRLEQNEWNISRAAAALGIERTNLHKKLKAYGIQRGQ
jgi:transcriptional regulator of acetoin/glycerol metabolism